jgi:hypothetical protein
VSLSCATRKGSLLFVRMLPPKAAAIGKRPSTVFVVRFTAASSPSVVPPIVTRNREGTPVVFPHCRTPGPASPPSEGG